MNGRLILNIYLSLFSALCLYHSNFLKIRQSFAAASYVESVSKCPVSLLQTNIGAPIWSSLPVHLNIDSSVPENAIPLILAAANQWESAIGFKVFTFSKTSGKSFAQDGVSSIVWNLGNVSSPPQEQAKTMIFFDNDFHQITEADIIVNYLNFKPSYNAAPNFTEIDFESLMVHELGHVLGLGHDSNTIMNEILPNGVVRRAIDSNIKYSVSCIYADRKSKLNILASELLETIPYLANAISNKEYGSRSVP